MNLIVADFHFQINTSLYFNFANSFLAYFLATKSKKVDCFIQISTTDFTFNPSEKVFSANSDYEDNYLINNYFWEVFQNEKHKYFIIFEKENKKPIAKANFNQTANNWDLQLQSDYYHNSNNIFPYPSFHLILYYFLESQNCLMMHASGVFKNKERAYLFSGFSGAGKSTISRIFAENDYEIINDDRLILRKIGSKWTIYNSPMFYQEKPQSASLSSIFLIAHGQQNQIHQLNGASALASVLSFCLQHNYNPKIIQKNISLITDLLLNVSVYQLAFLPESSIVNFIEKLDE